MAHHPPPSLANLQTNDLERLRVLANLTPEELASLADLATGIAICSRARKWLLVLAATVGAAATLVTVTYHVFLLLTQRS